MSGFKPASTDFFYILVPAQWWWGVIFTDLYSSVGFNWVNMISSLFYKLVYINVVYKRYKSTSLQIEWYYKRDRPFLLKTWFLNNPSKIHLRSQLATIHVIMNPKNTWARCNAGLYYNLDYMSFIWWINLLVVQWKGVFYIWLYCNEYQLLPFLVIRFKTSAERKKKKRSRKRKRKKKMFQIDHRSCVIIKKDGVIFMRL